MPESGCAPKETLVVVVGAGASIKAGLPSTADLLEVTQAALPTLQESGRSYILNGDSVMTAARTTRLADVLNEALRGAYGDYDFELLLHAIEELETYIAAREAPAMLEEFRPVLSAFTEIAQKYERIADSRLLRFARLQVITAIHKLVGERCGHPFAHMPNIPDPPGARAQINRILSTLAHSHRFIVVDLNYDDVVDLTAIPWGDGYGREVSWSKDPYLPREMAGDERCKAFSPDLWDEQVRNQDINLLIHLHGSILFGWPPIAGMRTMGRFAEPVKFASHQEALESLANFGYSGTVVSGQSYDATPLVSGQSKGGKMIYNARPYGYYYRTNYGLYPDDTEIAGSRIRLARRPSQHMD